MHTNKVIYFTIIIELLNKLVIRFKGIAFLEIAFHFKFFFNLVKNGEQCGNFRLSCFGGNYTIKNETIKPISLDWVDWFKKLIYVKGFYNLIAKHFRVFNCEIKLTNNWISEKLCDYIHFYKFQDNFSSKTYKI